VAALGVEGERGALGSAAVTSRLERSFRITALAEAASFLALLVATYVKHGHDQPVGVEILGPVHGLLFIAYVLLALSLAPRAGWSVRTTVMVLAGAVVPFGGIVVDRWLARRRVAAPS
jgi:integral membrane protein